MSAARTVWLSLTVAATLGTGCLRVIPSPVQVVVNSGAVTKDEVVSRSFATGAAPHVTVELFSGEITVTKGDGNAVRAEVTKRGRGDTEEAAQEMLKKIDVQMTQEGDRVRVSARVPPGERMNGEAPAKLQVPAGAALELRTSFGAVGVTGVNGAIDAKTSNGAVTVRGATGTLKLTTDFGKIDVEAPSPSVTAKTSNGAILVRGATGALDLTTDFNKIDVDAPCAAVKAKTSNGAILVKQAKGPLQLRTDFGNIEVETPGGPVAAHTSNGHIHVRGAKGRVEARTDFGGIDLAAEQAAVTAQTSNGALKFAGSLADGEHTFRNDFGDITVTLPADAHFALDARTNFGTITTGFPVTMSGAASKTHLQGRVGDNPAVTLKLTTSNGNIRVNPGN
jgi:DUF4097 and DUF4098 domain-containing protein YvlB